MLHIVTSVAALETARVCYHQDDELILIEDAIYAANRHHQAFNSLDGMTVFVLQNDVDARGVEKFIATSLSLVSYKEFVELSVKHKQSLTWR